MKPMLSRFFLIPVCLLSLNVNTQSSERQLLWGDTHVHTGNSFDAFLNGNRTTGPEFAYQFAQGVPVIHPLHRTRLQIDSPLDFIVIADHAEIFGTVRSINNDGIDFGDSWLDKIKAWYFEKEFKKFINQGFNSFISFLPLSEDPPEAAKSFGTDIMPIPNADSISKNVWNVSSQLADKYNEPGVFTTFIGWEWSSVPGGANLHRVVFSDGDSNSAKKFMPFSSIDSPFPEDLHQWLEEISIATGDEFIAIPHNSNISKGYMFPESTLRGKSFDAEIGKKRLRWEPVVEMTQYKGDSETYPALSPNDEFADFERYEFYIQQRPEPYKAHIGDFIRSALKRGLSLEQTTGFNPYRFGLIGSTDSHSSLVSVEEDKFAGKFIMDSIPENKRFRGVTPGVVTGWHLSASGLAAVWSQDNTRESILQAFKRREVYATTGPRIRVQLFMGWEFDESDLIDANFSNAYSKGVPMGGEIVGVNDIGVIPQILVKALKDPNQANLDRIQIIKGWIDGEGVTHEKIYEVAWSGQVNNSRQLNSQGKLERIQSNINLQNGQLKDSALVQGEAMLSALWQDPDFDSSQNAFYYARVLQIPTARHSLLDELALNESNTYKHKVIQERAYSSPIWYIAP